MKEAEKTELKEKIAKIADTYGYDAQSRQCMEEMAELVQAINKYWRKQGSSRRTDKEIAACMDNLVEEIADVQIMLWQMEYLLQADIMPIVNRKLNREMLRMKEG